MPHILLTDSISPRTAELLQEAGMTSEIRPTLPVETLSACLDDYDGIVVRSATRLDAAMLDGRERLRLIVRGGVGVDNIDIASASSAGIGVANTPGANSIATAELTFTMMLSLARRTIAAHQSVARGEWERAAFRGSELAGKTLGVVGLGRIGREVARRAAAFDMRVLAYDPLLSPEAIETAGATPASLEDVLRSADFVTLHVPLIEETRKMIDAAAIDKMKRSAFLVNCARGGLLDEAAVRTAILENRLAGVALDVYESEPPGADHPLVGVEGVVHLPHLGAYTREAQEKVADEVAEVIRRFFVAGEREFLLNAGEVGD